PKSTELTMVGFDATDFVERANGIAPTLTDEGRKLTTSDLLTRAGLLPATVKLTEDINFGNGVVRKTGKEIGPYKVFRNGGQVQLIAIDPDFVKNGKINDRQTYLFEATDFRKQLRAQLEKPKAADGGGETPAKDSRLLAELKGRLVDAEG